MNVRKFCFFKFQISFLALGLIRELESSVWSLTSYQKNVSLCSMCVNTHK